MNRVFFDCAVCAGGDHHRCVHGPHEALECKCVEKVKWHVQE
jgi:hypothetical protein